MLSKKLKTVLDLPRNIAYVGAFNIEIPIVKINGHICIALNQFPRNHFAHWQALSSILDQGTQDAEFIEPSPPPATSAAHVCAAASATMASGLEESGEIHPPSRASPTSVSDPDRAAGIENEGMAVASRSAAPEVDRQHDSSHEGSLRPSSEHAGKERKPPREFPKVLPVQHPLEVGGGRVGRAAIFTIAAAVATLGQLWGPNPMGRQAAPGTGCRGELDFTESELRSMRLEVGAPPINRPMVLQSGDLEFLEEHYQESLRTREQRRLEQASGSREQQAWEDPGEEEEIQVEHDGEYASNYDREIAIHRDMPTYKDVYDLPKIDILEVHAGRATITDQAVNYGLTALQPYGFQYGVDLTSKQQARAFQDTVRRTSRTFTTWVAEQDREGRFFVGEYETTGPLWSRPSVLDLVRRKNVTDFTCTSGSYGAEDADGYPDIRRHRWLSNHPGMHRKLSNELTEEQQAYCSPTPGDSSNGREPEDLCHGIVHSILETIQTEARLQYPARFQLKPHDVLYARPLNDAESWKQVLDEIENRFANTHKKPFVLTGTDPLRELIDNLVPWRIEKLQAAWTPQSRRFPQDIAFTHRGAALRLTTGEFALESEDMGQITYPKQRYARPVRVGLFFFGFPKETREPEEAPAEDEQPSTSSSTRPLHGFEPELWFEDPPREVDKKMQYSLARLHVNMGHAPRTELIRLLAASGNLSRKVLQGLDCLRCGSCLRMQKPRPPPVSSVAPAFTGYFGEVLQADIVYIRLITGLAVPVLGMACEATNYHASKALNSRNPGEMLQAILDIWYRPLGLPLHFKCDAGGEFAAEVAAWHGRSGILHEVIPAEAHHRLGKIERRNSLMRSLAERVIDERGVHSVAELNMVLPAIVFSMNSCTYSYGRSPYQAVFGRVPRPLGDLSSDPRALVLSPGDNDKRLAPELLRADALKALAEFNASSAVKRALLRKTRHQESADYQPGQPLAYWRWSGRSRQHKKRAWSLGRFLSVDPDRKSIWLQVGTTTVKVASNQVRNAFGWEEWTPSAEDIKILRRKSIWLQVGTTTVKVASNQVRNAFGWEEWTPSAEDIKILRDAENNLKDSLWEDHTEEPPGLLQEPTGEPSSLSAPPRLPPELQQPRRDYWRFTETGVTRVHVQPRSERVRGLRPRRPGRAEKDVP
eukprot:s1978_g4.t1